jgi:hypothetical protein
MLSWLIILVAKLINVAYNHSTPKASPWRKKIRNMILKRMPINTERMQGIDFKLTLYWISAALFGLSLPNSALSNLRGYTPSNLSRVSMGANRFVTPSGKVCTVSEGEIEMVFDLARNEWGFEIGFIIFAIILRRAKDVFSSNMLKS